ncbi:hypothetical protein C8248_12485 [Paracidovorax avenae]|uniref:hypothetical protein n=1 Tax=Paracidovorax avenae TaxID=80867 RepID=UPI000D20FA8D|nr:hypothetical protein [Paracidovorax avenae]AVT06682.1 hypothetical protein C8248_12485 [Paracidovorax avenae]
MATTFTLVTPAGTVQVAAPGVEKVVVAAKAVPANNRLAAIAWQRGAAAAKGLRRTAVVMDEL